jgi:hypothetical protein
LEKNCAQNGHKALKTPNLKRQIPNNNQISKPPSMFGILNFGHCYLSFNFAQDGEPVEPFVVWDVLFVVFFRSFQARFWSLPVTM